MSTNMTFQMQHIPQVVVIYGVGGTGSRIVPALAQLISKLPTMISPEMILVDFDIVETKNLERQNFASVDVNKNKATVLAARYSKAYNVKITPIEVAAGTPEYLEALRMFGVFERLCGPALHIIAVDSAKARRQILESAMQMQAGSQHSSIVVDCGNEDIFGQVSYFTTASAQPESAMEMETVYNWYQGVIPEQIIIPELPIDADYYAHMVDGQSTRSCADLDQTLAINNLMAAMAIAISQNILMGKPMNFGRVSFDLFNGVSYDPLQIPDIVRRIARINEISGSSKKDDQPAKAITRGVICQSGAMTSTIHSVFSELDAEMLSDNPARYEQSKMVRTALNLPAFEPSMLMASRYPDQYRPEWVSLWKEGYKLPEIPEKDREIFEELMRIYRDMEAECARLNGEVAPTPDAAAEAQTVEVVDSDV